MKSIPEHYVNTKYIAKILGYTTARISQLAKSGQIPAIKRGKRWFFDPGLVVGTCVKPNKAAQIEHADSDEELIIG